MHSHTHLHLDTYTHTTLTYTYIHMYTCTHPFTHILTHAHTYKHPHGSILLKSMYIPMIFSLSQNNLSPGVVPNHLLKTPPWIPVWSLLSNSWQLILVRVPGPIRSSNCVELLGKSNPVSSHLSSQGLLGSFVHLLPFLDFPSMFWGLAC